NLVRCHGLMVSLRYLTCQGGAYAPSARRGTRTPEYARTFRGAPTRVRLAGRARARKPSSMRCADLPRPQLASGPRAWPAPPRGVRRAEVGGAPQHARAPLESPGWLLEEGQPNGASRADRDALAGRPASLDQFPAAIGPVLRLPQGAQAAKQSL